MSKLKRIVRGVTGGTSTDPCNTLPSLEPTRAIQVTATNVNNIYTAGRDINLTTVEHHHIYTPPIASFFKDLEGNLNPIPTAAFDSHGSKAEKCFQGTRVELLDEIWNWISGRGSQASIYVLDGVAGIGKSTVAQTVAYQAANMGILGASYFFTRDEQERQTTQRFAPTIAYQLALHNENFAQHLASVLDQHPDVFQKHLRQQLAILVLEPLQNFLASLEKEQPSLEQQPILIVIDALDECKDNEAKSLLRILVEDFQGVPRLKIFITTRPEFHVRQVLDYHDNHERFHLHEIDDSIVQNDIQLYLAFHLSSREIQRHLPGIRPWEPNAEEMKKLQEICGTLFIIASTAVRFILDEWLLNPAQQLSRLLDGVSPGIDSSITRMDVMDKFYMHILLSALPDGRRPASEVQDWICQYRAILGAVITLQNPLPCHSLAGLLNIDDDDIERTLARLHSLVAPRGQGRIYRIHHKTFPDFITDENRINQALIGLAKNGRIDGISFLIDTKRTHSRLAKRCFHVMMSKLKRNMCNLDLFNQYRDSAELLHLTQSVVPLDSEFAYTCTHWASHLQRGDMDVELEKCLENWVHTHLLSWVEVLCIIDQIGGASKMLEKAERRIVDVEHSNAKETTQMLNDIRQLVHRNMPLLRRAPMHLYWSILPFSPVTSTVYERYCRHSGGLKVISGDQKDWNPLTAILEGHSSLIACVAFSSDGSRLASGSSDKTVRLWDGNTGAYIATLEGHSADVTSLAFSSDGSRLASVSFDSTLRLWDGNTGAYSATLKRHSHWITSIAFSSDGSRLAFGSDDRTVRLCDGNTGAQIAILEGHSETIKCIAFSSDGSTLASGSSDKTVRLWDGNNGAYIDILTGHSNRVRSVAFSGARSGFRLASGSEDKTLRLWDGNTGALMNILEGHSDWVTSVAFSSDGSRLASGSYDRTVRLWNTDTGMQIARLDHSSGVVCVAFSSNGSRLASGSEDKTLRLWDGNAGAEIPAVTSKMHSRPITSVAFSGDGSRLASGSKDQTVRLWDGNTGAHITTLGGHWDWVRSVAYSCDGSRVASGSDDKTVRLWDGNTGARIATLEGHSSCVRSVAFSGDGSRLASGSDKTVWLWEGNTGAHISRLEGHSSTVISIAFSADGSRLVSGSDDNTVRLWNGRTGAHVTTLEGHSDCVRSVAFSHDGLVLASGSWDKTVRFWEGNTGAHIFTFASDSIATIHEIAFPRDHLTSNPPSTPQSAISQTGSKRLFSLVQTYQPKTTGLVALIKRPNGQYGHAPFVWLPPHILASTFAINGTGSLIAVGCEDGQVLLLDISQVMFP